MNKLKFFLNFDKEESWLNRLAAAGQLLSKAGPLYRFAAIEPASAVVRVDYRPAMKAADFADYVTLFADAGWQHLDGSRHGGAQYFASFDTGADTEIFSDSRSRAQRYRRSIAAHSALLLPFAVFCVILWMQSGMTIDPRSWYLTPGLWEKQGGEFLGAFLFETIFVLFRAAGPLLITAFCAYCIGVIAYQSHLYRDAVSRAESA